MRPVVGSAVERLTSFGFPSDKVHSCIVKSRIRKLAIARARPKTRLKLSRRPSQAIACELAIAIREPAGRNRAALVDGTEYRLTRLPACDCGPALQGVARGAHALTTVQRWSRPSVCAPLDVGSVTTVPRSAIVTKPAAMP
jgi:hypothetical protein